MSNESAARTRASGYVTEIPYMMRYHRDLNPSILKLALAMQGIDWSKDPADCDYIELGCGFGLSLLFNAAGYPRSRFVGVDINPEHTDTGRGIAASAGLGNIRFVEAAFAELDSHIDQSFDVIALHGVWSWINEDNRQHILRFIDRRLRPGGLVYLSYNTLPGLAAALPLRELMVMGFESASGSVEARVEAGVAFAEKLQAAGSVFFKINPRAGETLAQIRGQSSNALAHEYFNADWRAFYHADVAASFGALGLAYGSSARLLDNIDHLNFPPAAREILGQTAPERREALKDYLVNREFRRDIFLRGTAQRQNPAGLLSSVAVASAGSPAGAGKLSAQTALGNVTLKTDIAVPVLTALLGGSASTLDLMTHPACAGLRPADVLDTVVLLTALGGADPALPAASYGERKATADRLNGVLWEAALKVGVIQSSVSPVTAGGIGLQRIEQLFLLARRRGEDAETFIRRVFGVNVQGDVAANYKQFMDQRLPILQKLGIG